VRGASPYDTHRTIHPGRRQARCPCWRRPEWLGQRHRAAAVPSSPTTATFPNPVGAVATPICFFPSATTGN